MLVKTRTLVGTLEFFKGISSVHAARSAVVLGYDYLAARNKLDYAVVLGYYEYAGVVCYFSLDTRTYYSRFGL